MAESSRDAHGGSTLEWAPEQSTIAGRGHDAKRGHSGGSVKDKATRICMILKWELLVIFHLILRGRLLRGDTHIRPVSTRVSGKSF
jgi:hypothetical protein